MTPTQVVTLGALAVAWLAIAFPLAMRTRSESLAGTITGFNQAMSVLEPKLKAPTVSAASPQFAAHREQSSTLHLLRRLFAMAVLTTLALAVAAVMWGTVFVPLFVISLVATGAYVSLLRRRKIEQDRARAVITSIRDGAHLSQPTRRPASLPAAVGQGTVSGDVRRGGMDHRRGDAGSFRDAGSPRSEVRVMGGPQRGDAGSYRSDVRVMAGQQRIQAYQGFDVLN